MTAVRPVPTAPGPTMSAAPAVSATPSTREAPAAPTTPAAPDAPTIPASSLVPVALLAWCTGLAYLPAFGFAALLPVVTVAATVPVLLAFLVSRTLRYPLWSATALSALAALFAACATLYRDRAPGGFLPTPSLARELGASLIDAPQSLLGMILPAPPEPRLLVLVFATVWAVGYASAELALRHPGRTLPVLPAVLPLAAVPLLGIGGNAPNPPVAPVAVLAAGLVVLMRSLVGPGPGRAWRLAPGVALAALVALLAVGVSAVLPGASRQAVDLRTHVDRPPPLEVEGLNPLDRISAWLRDPERPMFTVSAPGAAADQVWRLTVFERFDGVAWRPVPQLEPSGGRVPRAADADTGADTVRLTQRITVQRLPGPWLPAADRPTEVDVVGDDARIAVDPVSGVVAGGSRLAPGTEYTVVSEVPVHAPESTQFALPADDPDNIRIPLQDAAGAEIPAAAALRDLAEQATAGSSFPYQQALRLAEWLRVNCTFDPEAVSGHSYRNLQFFLETSKRGTPEQFAAAFAVMARALNLPARVAVGFRSPPAVDGVVHVRAGDVTAWAEVHFAGLGWVPFFPTPAPGAAAAAVPPPEAAAPQPVPEQTGAPEQPTSRADADARIRDTERDAVADSAIGGASSKLPWWVWPVGTGAALTAVVLTRTHGVPALRRRRRGRGTPDRRIVGAWAQVEERLRRLGMPAAEAMTACDVAAYGRRRLGDSAGEALGVLAGIYNDVVFSEPADRADLRPAAALAWRCCREVEAAARRAAAPRGGWRRGATGQRLFAPVARRSAKDSSMKSKTLEIQGSSSASTASMAAVRSSSSRP